MKRINVGDAIIAGGIGLGGAASGLSRGVTGLLAVAAVFASMGIRHLWQVRMIGRDGDATPLD